MNSIKKIRQLIIQLFEEIESNTNKDVRGWPFLLWLFLATAAGFYGRLLAPHGYRLLIGLVCFLGMAAILYKPMVKLGKKK